jgi:hypothetical protein
LSYPRLFGITILLIIILLAALAQPSPQEEVVVSGRAEPLVGEAASASEGVVGPRELGSRPLLRPGEILETVPGLIVTQHSGTGKANQYFLRGFNLDHGTDFAVWVDGMPVNLPTHGHGQGYADANFLIPELIEEAAFRKGPLRAEEGDFSSAGAVRIRSFRRLPDSLAVAEVGEFGRQRGLVAHDAEAGPGRLLAALEAVHYDGPWIIGDDGENYVKFNGLLRYSAGTDLEGWDVSFLGYSATWHSADQIPRRAVLAGALPRTGVVDPSDGGESRRLALLASWRSGGWSASLYAVEYQMRLFSNFTYAIDPVNGDQFEQVDRRAVVGGTLSHRLDHALFGSPSETTFGLDLRNDVIVEVGLHQTTQRARWNTVRDDAVLQTSLGFWISDTTPWTPWLRTVAGARADVYLWDVDSSLAANSGSAADGIVSPRVNVVLGPWERTEFYAGFGLGFHSNDGRGATITVDPTDGVTPVAAVDPLVRTLGAEAGVRSTAVPGLQTGVSVFLLDIDSELLFIGDAGITAPTRPSRRIGVEWTNHWDVLPWLTVDADVAFTRARFRDPDPAGDRIPGAVEGVVSAGIRVHDLAGFEGAVRVRWFGPRPLIEDDSSRSASTTLLNLHLGYRWGQATLSFEVLNLLDSTDDDITYLYDSRLPAEGAPVTDQHFHPVEPRSFRVSLTLRF